jgi:hypothetical protein
MSSWTQPSSSEPSGRKDHPPSAGNISKTTAALTIANNDGLLGVLRDLADAVKKLEAHVTAGSSQPAPQVKAPGIHKMRFVHGDFDDPNYSLLKVSLNSYTLMIC